jgi:preprotein translocase subunit YajC
LQTLFWILAQTSAPASGPSGPARPWWAGIFGNQFFPIILIMVVLYVFMIRSKKNQERQRREVLAQLKRGDRVQTIGGVLGTVVEARDDEVLLKVDEGSNTKMRFTRAAIHRVLEAEKPAQNPGKDAK